MVPGTAAVGGRPSGGGEQGRADPGEQLGALYGALATGCGYDYRSIDAMTLAEAGEIFRYWEDNPPPHLMLQAIARMLGWSPPPPRDTRAGLARLAAAPPPGLTVARGGIAMPPPLDLATLRARNRALAHGSGRS